MATLMTQKEERRLIGILGTIQFINVVDFMMVMPLGPDFAVALGIPTSHLGFIGGSYTAAAAVAGLLGATFLERFDRKTALLVAFLGLALSTVVGGLAQGMASLLVGRIVAGACGGPVTSLAFSIVADTIPFDRRGRAMGALMSSFSIASILGVPLGLELARWGGWRAPFFAVGMSCLLIAFAAWRRLPSLRGHLELQAQSAGLPVARLFRKDVIVSYVGFALGLGSAFLLIPNISAYFQFNLGYPRARMGLLYLCGGLASFFMVRFAGKLTDRVGVSPVLNVMTLILVFVFWEGYAQESPWLSPLVLFTVMMVSLSTRNIVISTLGSRVPGPLERAKFMSMQSAVVHVSTATGSFLSTRFLAEGVAGRLTGMPTLAWMAIGCSLVVPPILWPLEKRVRARERSGALPTSG